MQSTAKKTGGLCRPCDAGPDLVQVAERIEIGSRFLLAVVGAVIFGGIGYAVGALLSVLGGVVLAIPCAVIGFVYGFFKPEIHAILGLMVGWLVDP